jgi:hypothetical protein
MGSLPLWGYEDDERKSLPATAAATVEPSSPNQPSNNSLCDQRIDFMNEPELMKKASDLAFLELSFTGKLNPFVLVKNGDGSLWIYKPQRFEDQKDKGDFATAVKANCLMDAATECVFVAEAWTLKLKPGDEGFPKSLEEARALGSLSKHPLRVECIVAAYEDLDGGHALKKIEINRDLMDSFESLGKEEIVGLGEKTQSSGIFTRLLPPSDVREAYKRVLSQQRGEANLNLKKWAQVNCQQLPYPSYQRPTEEEEWPEEIFN